jgi:flagellar biogenesis protein FliO
MVMWRVGFIFLVVCAGAAWAGEGGQGRDAGGAGAGATTQGSVHTDYDRIELTRSPRGGASAPGSASDNVFTVGRVTLALGVVLGCIFILRWASRHVLGLPGGGSHEAIQVLCRSMVSPRQQLMLVQVGRRLVLVANCGAQMNSLCEITDADEIAGILGQLHRRKNSAGTGAFLSLFRGASAPYEDAARDDEAPAEVKAEANGEVELAATRQELSGLLEKVRSVSRSFPQT